jgi:hypothetical protein
MEVRDDPSEPNRGHELPVGVDDKLVGRLLVDDPATRPVFVFVPHDDRRQQGNRGLGLTATPSLPDVVVSGGTGEAVAVRLGDGQGVFRRGKRTPFEG